MNPLYIYFIIFFCIGYLIVSDASVARLFVLLTGLVRIKYEQIKWFLLHNPRNIIVRWMMHRKSMKMAEKLMKEFEEKNK
jgi:hypothetical protein